MRSNIRACFITSLFIVLLFSPKSYSQDDWWKVKKYKSEESKKKYELCKLTFKEIANGFSYSSIGLITKYFNGEVFLDILGNEKGYYTTGQAEYLLSDFIEYFKVTNVKYINSYHKNSYAFVMGKYYYNIGSGKRELKLSVSLKYRNGSWFVDQINLN